MSLFKRIEPNDEKLQELILYIADKCQGDESFGATKLNKLLFYADFMAYLNFGQAITGHPYKCLEQGPVPTQLKPIRDRMEEYNDIVLVERQYHGYKQTRIIPRRDADLTLFTADEIRLVDTIIAQHESFTAKEISEQSHEFIGWKFANIGEEIPYEVCLIGLREPTPEEIRIGLSLEPLAEKYLGTQMA